MNDLIETRCIEGLCPICKVKIETAKTTWVDYNGLPLEVCEHHLKTHKEVKDEEGNLSRESGGLGEST